VAVFLCQFHRQSLFTASQKLHHFPRFSAGSSACFVWQFLSIPTHHPIRILFFIKISLDNYCILLYNIARFYEKLFFLKKDCLYERKRNNDGQTGFQNIYRWANTLFTNLSALVKSLPSKSLVSGGFGLNI